MLSSVIADNERFRTIIDRLSEKSVDDYYNPYQMFRWPDTLPADMWWMSPHLTTFAGTDLADELSEQQQRAVSRYESINFYSLNVHGIRELLVEVTRRIHTRGYESASEFFHHFIGEENEHMWFFAEFCLRYGGKIYTAPRGGASVPRSDEVETLLVFARILIFEELVDYFNSTMERDDSLHETIRLVNRIHHQDETRHIAFGRELVSLLYRDLRRTATTDDLAFVDHYLERYIRYSFESLFNPRVYADAGLTDPLQVRNRLLRAHENSDFRHRIFRKPRSFLEKTGILAGRVLAEEPAGRQEAR
ncbi:diiron oxygenase [Nocardia sp. BMG51109]|uniref:diiron oxygenase n=1 Tax=Nocardia sp. BMG51109 TaxID=1056816 RepID=UPI00046730A0|nr:diiron oxygenase [Nocardia sp. BMG51109]